MKRTILIMLLLIVFTLGIAGCSGGNDLMTGEKREPMKDSLFSILDEETRDFFENFTDGSAEFMTVNYDQHFAEAIVRDKDTMCAMVEALSDIQVTAKTNISSTDGYHSVGFITADGKKRSISFENSALHYDGDNYVIENAEKFWKLFKVTAEEGWEHAQENTAQYESAPVSYANEDISKSVSCVLLSSEAKETSDKHWLDASAALSFTNTGDTPVPGVDVEILFLNPDGYIVGEASVTADFSATPLAPGVTSEYTVQSRIYDFSSSGASVGGMMGALVTVVGISATGSDTAASQTPLFEFYNDPDITAFADGFYSDPPQTLTILLNWYDSRESIVTEKETIEAVFEALRKMRVGEAVNEMYTDSDTHYCFAYDDGREYVFSFNAGNLMINTDEHQYQQCFRASGGDDLSTLMKKLFEQ